MLTTRHPVDCPDTRQELEALFCYAHDHDVKKGGAMMPARLRSTCGRTIGEIQPPAKRPRRSGPLTCTGTRRRSMRSKPMRALPWKTSYRSSRAWSWTLWAT
jgi:hypothetical protein